MILNTDSKQLELLEIRASCGRWVKRGGRIWTEILDRELDVSVDLRNWTITDKYSERVIPRQYNVNLSSVKARIKTIKQLHYVLEKPQYPELKEFLGNYDFRSVEERLIDMVESRRLQTKQPEPKTGLESLMEMYLDD